METQYKLFYKIGAISVFMALFVMLTEIFLTALPDGARVEMTIEQLYEMYNRNWFMAMRYMGLLNIIATTLMLPVFFSLYALHRDKFKAYAGFSLLLSVTGYAIFISDNTSFAFLELANKFQYSNSGIDRSILIAAGEALFAKGASHTPGTFPGFFIGQVACIFFSLIMITGNIFKKSTGILGLIAFSFLLIFEIVSSFINSLYDEAMIFAMIGGILSLVWYVMVGLGLLKHSK